ncbi:hypothetical protein AGMMS49579_24950 [Spirochaetia bacterium]|nr:hypothetical protein AGMMS49579_24950 [Spirochaetia bacterium]
MGQYYFLPFSASYNFWEYLTPLPGFRAALGYEWRRFDFSLESGYTFFTGKIKHIENVGQIPILFKAGYTFPLPEPEGRPLGLGIRPEAGIGGVLFAASRYPSDIPEADLQSGDLEKESFQTPELMATLRVNLVWKIPKAPVLSLHVGAGLDMIVEEGNPVFIPAIEAGIAFKPRLPRRSTPPPPSPEVKPDPPPLLEVRPAPLPEVKPPPPPEEVKLPPPPEEVKPLPPPPEVRPAPPPEVKPPPPEEVKPPPPPLPEVKPPPPPPEVKLLPSPEVKPPPPLTKSDEELLTNLKQAVKDDADIAVEAVIRGIMMTVWNINFAPDSDQFLPTEYPRLDMIAAALRLVPANHRFLVEGHVADVPSPVDNMELSYRRTARMVEALTQRGLSQDRFVFLAWGGEKPLGDNATEAGRRLNRRVEITVLKEGLYQ